MKAKTLKLLSLCLLLALLTGSALPGFAATKPILITGSGVLWIGAEKCPVVVLDMPENATSIKVKTSNKQILKVGTQEGFGPIGWWMQPGSKAGKAKLTVQYKVGSRTKKLTATFTVSKYPNPFEYIKVNGKKIDLKKHVANYVINDYDNDKITVAFKVKSGWTATCDGNRIKNGDWQDLSWKSGKAISLKGYDGADLLIKLKNKKTGATCEYEIPVSR